MAKMKWRQRTGRTEADEERDILRQAHTRDYVPRSDVYFTMLPCGCRLEGRFEYDDYVAAVESHDCGA